MPSVINESDENLEGRTLNILIVRTSSLGDLVHMLPAITEITRHIQNAKITWLVEEAFAEIPKWHPAVDEVLVVAHRRWRKDWWSPRPRRERALLKRRLAQDDYDIVLDMQALLKSAWLVRQTNGVKHGLDWRSAREPLATLAYDVRHKVEFWQPAVIRQRELAGKTFGYEPSGPPDFGLSKYLPTDASPAYAAIMPSASRDDKLWPAEDWRQVFSRLIQAGIGIRILAGNAAEELRGRALIEGLSDAVVLPRMSLTEVMKTLAGARLMVGLDSGLTHLSAALGRPTIGIYRASTPVRTPLTGSGMNFSLGDRGQSPSLGVVLAAVDQILGS